MSYKPTYFISHQGEDGYDVVISTNNGYTHTRVASKIQSGSDAHASAHGHAKKYGWAEYDIDASGTTTAFKKE